MRTIYYTQNHDIPILWHQKREKGKGRNSFSHTKKYNWQMQREDLMFSQYMSGTKKMMLAPW